MSRSYAVFLTLFFGITMVTCLFRVIRMVKDDPLSADERIFAIVFNAVMIALATGASVVLFTSVEIK